MTSGVPKKFHGGTLRVPWGHRAEAGWVFPLHATHSTGRKRDGKRGRLSGVQRKNPPGLSL